MEVAPYAFVVWENELYGIELPRKFYRTVSHTAAVVRRKYLMINELKLAGYVSEENNVTVILIPHCKIKDYETHLWLNGYNPEVYAFMNPVHKLSPNMENTFKTSLSPRDLVNVSEEIWGMCLLAISPEQYLLGRTSFIPKEITVDNELYAGIELKGATPDFKKLRVPRDFFGIPAKGSRAPLYGMFLSDAEREVRMNRRIGLRDPYYVGIIEPLSNGKRIHLEYTDGSSGYPAIIVRLRKTNLDMSFYDLLPLIVKYIGVDAKTFFYRFIEELISTFFKIIQHGYVHWDLHTQNVTILGTIKPSDDLERYESGKDDVVLASNIMSINSVVDLLGYKLGFEDWKRVLFYVATKVVGKKIERLKDMFNLSKKVLKKSLIGSRER